MTQTVGVVTPGEGGTVSTPQFDLTYGRGVIGRAREVTLEDLHLDPFREAIPGTGGRLAAVCRIRPQDLEFDEDQTATLTYKSPGFKPGAVVAVYRQEESPEFVADATPADANYSMEIDRHGTYFWVLRSNFCLQFDGINDNVLIPHSSVLNVTPTDAFTWELWFKTAATSTDPCRYHVMLGSWGPGSYVGPFPYEVRLWLGDCWADGYLVFIVYDGDVINELGDAGLRDNAQLQAEGPWNDDTWHHFAGVRNGRDWQGIYVDGQLIIGYVPAYLPGPVTNWRPITIGGDQFNFHAFEGLIDEVRMWKVARTQAEIQADMCSRLTGSEPNLAALWNFDEGGGSVAHDSTANLNHGGLVNGPEWVEATWPSSP